MLFCLVKKYSGSKNPSALKHSLIILYFFYYLIFLYLGFKWGVVERIGEYFYPDVFEKNTQLLQNSINFKVKK
jgi:hypothetical protein